MNTTQVFVELLITGFGGLAWIAIFICAICGIDIKFIFDQNYSTFFIVPVSGLAYVIGILIDRLGYRIFINSEKKNIPEVFVSRAENEYPKKDGKIHPESVIAFITHGSAHMKEQMMYNRTRLRLCRSWILNFLLISVSLLIYNLLHFANDPKITWALSFLALMFCLIAFFVWKTLARDYYVNIKSNFDLLKEGKWVDRKDDCE